LAAGGCAGSPKLPEEPDTYVAASELSEERAADLAAAPASAWLAEIDAPEMISFVQETLAASPELQAVEGRARAARWRARGSAGGNLLPSLTLGVFGSRTETPDGTGARIRDDVMTSDVSASWELDLWGRLSSRALASDLSADAAEQDVDSARLSVSGQAARGWAALIEAQQRYALAQEELDTTQRALDITQRRYDMGVTSSLALRTARSQVASARAFEAEAAESMRRSSRRLQEIMGRYPDGTLSAEGILPSLPPLAAAGAPEDLLDRRPDVLASEARMRAAGFRMHEARAAMLPRLTLTGSAGSRVGPGGALDDIDDSVNMVSNVVAGITMPIFQGGALFSESRASVAERQAAASDYVRTALSAWHEVEGAISADSSLEVRETQFAIAAEEARAAQELAEREYGRGVATIFELIDAYSRRISAERGLIGARSERVANRITYHVALGGGARTGGLATADREAPPETRPIARTRR
jgi:NodT family efflux transporter outer membrane factor (OMF) lipoprotein